MAVPALNKALRETSTSLVVVRLSMNINMKKYSLSLEISVFAGLVCLQVGGKKFADTGTPISGRFMPTKSAMFDLYIHCKSIALLKIETPSQFLFLLRIDLDWPHKRLVLTSELCRTSFWHFVVRTFAHKKNSQLLLLFPTCWLNGCLLLLLLKKKTVTTLF